MAAIKRRDGYKLASFRKTERTLRMKRIAVWALVVALVVALAAGCWTAMDAQDAGVGSARQTEKSEQRQRNALYKYQKKQEKAQEKAQRTADKQQRKAAKKYEKQQRKMLKNVNTPAKPTP
jgi:hypothetical protein